MIKSPGEPSSGAEIAAMHRKWHGLFHVLAGGLGATLLWTILRGKARRELAEVKKNVSASYKPRVITSWCRTKLPALRAHPCFAAGRTQEEEGPTQNACPEVSGKVPFEGKKGG